MTDYDYERTADALRELVGARNAEIARLRAEIAAAEARGYARAVEDAASECDKKHEGCVGRQRLCAEAGDTKNEEWFRAKANACEVLARDIRALSEQPGACCACDGHAACVHTCERRCAAAPKPGPVCTRCNDTHKVPAPEGESGPFGDGTWMCTSCPTPCERCRAGGRGPYCATTPCACACHRRNPYAAALAAPKGTP